MRHAHIRPRRFSHAQALLQNRGGFGPNVAFVAQYLQRAHRHYVIQPRGAGAAANAPGCFGYLDTRRLRQFLRFQNAPAPLAGGLQSDRRVEVKDQRRFRRIRPPAAHRDRRIGSRPGSQNPSLRGADLRAGHVEIGIEVERDRGEVIEAEFGGRPVSPVQERAKPGVGECSRAELLFGPGRIERLGMVFDAAGKRRGPDGCRDQRSLAKIRSAFPLVSGDRPFHVCSS